MKHLHQIKQYFWGKDFNDFIERMVSKEIFRRILVYKSTPVQKGDQINRGSFGNIFLLESKNHAHTYVQKEMHSANNTSNSAKQEARISDIIGKEGAKARLHRRYRKGYPLDVRFSSPLVLSSNPTSIDMEYFERGDLTKPHLSLDIYDMFKQTSKIVKDIHTLGVIHGDIKPANLLLGNDDKIRITDFSTTTSEKYLDTDQILGAPLFLDLHRLREKKLQRKSVDLYATAVTVLSYGMSQDKFLREASKVTRNSSNPEEMSMALKKLYIKTAENIPDKQIGGILLKMLNHEYKSMDDVLKALHQNSTIQDKKELKRSLSYIEDVTTKSHILYYIKNRMYLIDEIQEHKKQKEIYEGASKDSRKLFHHKHQLLMKELEKVENTISEALVNACQSNKNPIEQFHIMKLAEKIRQGKFTKHYFILTESSINRQKVKKLSMDRHCSKNPFFNL
jgi:serine/threonine protein kinase